MMRGIARMENEIWQEIAETTALSARALARLPSARYLIRIALNTGPDYGYIPGRFGVEKWLYAPLSAARLVATLTKAANIEMGTAPKVIPRFISPLLWVPRACGWAHFFADKSHLSILGASLPQKMSQK